MNKTLSVMHGLSEVAGQNSYAVMGLKQIRIDAQSVVYYKHPFGYSFDHCLNIDKTKRLFLPYYALKLSLFFVYAMFRYNTFHFHFGHSILETMELPLYSLFAKKCFFEFHGSDLRDQKVFCNTTGMFFDPKETTDPKLHQRNKKICNTADGIIIHDDELIPYLPIPHCPVFVVPLRINVDKFQVVYPKLTNRIRIVHAPSKRAIKGTQYVLEAFGRLKKRYDNLELILVEGKTQQEALEIYKTADIIVDQLIIGTYGVFAIESMAMGKPVITNINGYMKERLPKELPIVSANIHTIENALEILIKDHALREKLGIMGRLYVENYHDYRAVAYVLRDIYLGTATPLTGRKAFEQVKDIKNRIRSSE